MRDLLKGAEPVDALWIPPDPLVLEAATRRFVIARRCWRASRSTASRAAMIREGALVSHSPDIASIGQGVGELIGRIADAARRRSARRCWSPAARS